MIGVLFLASAVLQAAAQSVEVKTPLGVVSGRYDPDSNATVSFTATNMCNVCQNGCTYTIDLTTASCSMPSRMRFHPSRSGGFASPNLLYHGVECVIAKMRRSTW